ncbi:MAG: EscT/YscT/HrcT family type III secretion system export apparatus protein [Polaromonas sp.]|jgi:type III secretion protein T
MTTAASLNLLDLPGLGISWFSAVFATFPRTAAALWMLPLFFKEVMPATARLAFAFPLAVFFAYAGFNASSAPGFSGLAGSGLWPLFVMKEVLIGMGIGFLWALPFHTLSQAGELIDFQNQLTFTQSTDPFSGNQVSVTSTFLQQVFIMLFLSSGGLMLFVETLSVSFKAWPAQHALPLMSQSFLNLVYYEVKSLFVLSMLFAAPILLVMLLVDLSLGVINKAAPQVSIQDVSVPIKLALSWWLLLVALAFMAERLVQLMPRLANLLPVLTR